jgi:hypothetical protein
VDIFSILKDESRIKANRQQFLDTKIKLKGGGGRGNGGEKSGAKSKFRKPGNKLTIDGKLMYYHFRDECWKPVDKTPAKIAADKKSAAAKADKLEAAPALLTAHEAAPAGYGMTATPTSTGTHNKDKL